MKGVVFTEFLEHAEGQIGPIELERMIDRCPLHSGGAYTSVGTYPCSEMVSLVVAFATITGDAPASVLRGFGRRLNQTFATAYPQYYQTSSYFDFIESIDSHIHVEVQKLYPDAELPKFSTVSRDETTLVIDYLSSRNLEDLAHGLLEASAETFGEVISVQPSIITQDGQRIVRFRLEKR